MKYEKLTLLAVLLGSLGAAQADVRVGVTVSATGPAASLGIAEKNTIALLPTQVAGEKSTMWCWTTRPTPPRR